MHRELKRTIHSAASIQGVCRVRNKDIRKFLDGMGRWILNSLYSCLYVFRCLCLPQRDNRGGIKESRFALLPSVYHALSMMSIEFALLPYVLALGAMLGCLEIRLRLQTVL